MISENLKSRELAIFNLRGLYKKYGFLPYKMSKFEEYDLYVKNKDFLVSDNIITFTDTDGKLLALKPDVTLSIIKNTKDEFPGVRKVFYDENVYRVSKGTGSYKEIMQAGLECIGDVTDYNIYETISLAAESLALLSDDFVLDISHLGIVSDVLEGLNLSETARRDILFAISEKNASSVGEICRQENVPSDTIELLISSYGKPKDVIDVLKTIDSIKDSESLSQLIKITSLLMESDFSDKIRIDFSVINHMGYYNGFVFRGFINGISSGILSGGQYDALMQKMKRSSRAIGFAVYLDMLETPAPDYDIDTILLYDKNCDLTVLKNTISELSKDGKSVSAQTSLDEKLMYRKLLRLTEKGVEVIEDNA